MTYTIEETNLEQQHLFARFLEPLTLHALKNISLKNGATIDLMHPAIAVWGTKS